jgi:hypothetical protein
LSELVCYIERAERGVLPLRLRLLSTRVEATWSFPEVLADDRAALRRGLVEGAEWLAGQLKTHARAGLGALVLDADGARCGWVSVHGTDPDAVGAMIRQAAEPMSEEDAAHTMGSTPQLSLNPDVRIPGGASFQPLGAGDTAQGARKGLLARAPQPTGPQRQRLGVAAVPDATIRLFLDELDSRGIDIARIVTIWHALAEAFDAAGTHHAERVVSAAAGTTAQIIADPGAGRLVWAWARGGAPIAGGAFRLPRGVATGEGPAPVVLGRPELARLATEWIAWSTQLGASPTRLRLVLTGGAWEGAPSLGESVAAVWPGATADIAFDDDPIATTLTRFADSLGDPRVAGAGRPTMHGLTGRPGRQHRAKYRWGAVAIALAAVAMGTAAYQVHRSASEARVAAGRARTEWRETAARLLPGVGEGTRATAPWDPRAVEDVQAELELQRRKVAPVATDPPKPILQELETLSFILGNAAYTLEEVFFTENAVTIKLIVPDTGAYEELLEALNRIAGSSVTNWLPTPKSAPTGIRVDLVGTWGRPARGPGGA